MNRKETFEVTAYPINSKVFVIKDNEIHELSILQIHLTSESNNPKPFIYVVKTESGSEEFYSCEVFPTKQKLLDSL